MTRREQAYLEMLKQHYKNQGYEFFERPLRTLLPPNLGSYEPDAIAIGKSPNVLIEISTKKDQNVTKQITNVIDRLKGDPNWTVEVHHLGPDDDDILRKPQRSEVRLILAESYSLADRGLLQAALILAWSALEGVARYELREAALLHSQRPSDLIERLTAEGKISQSAGKRIRGLVPARNAAAHGDFTKTVQKADVDLLISEARRLEAEMQ